MLEELQAEYLKERIKTERLRQEMIVDRLRPSTLYRSFLYFDEGQWVCVGGLEDEQLAQELHDKDVTSTIYGYGESPEDAMEDFDRAWHTGEFEIKI